MNGLRLGCGYQYKTEAEKFHAAVLKETTDRHQARYDVAMEQVTKMQRAGRELSKRHTELEAAHAALQRRLHDAETANEDLRAQLQSWQDAHAAVAEQYTGLVAERDALAIKCTETVETEKQHEQELLQEHAERLERIMSLEKMLETERNAKEALNEQVEQQQGVIERLNRLIEDMQADSDATVGSLRSYLAKAQQEAREARDELQQRSEEIQQARVLRAAYDELKHDVDAAEATKSNLQNQNEVLSDALKKVLDRLHDKADESDFFVDRRKIEKKVKEYYSILVAQGMVNVIGRPKEELLFVLCEACGIQPDLATICFGLPPNVASRVTKTRLQAEATLTAAAAAETPEGDDASIPKPDTGQPPGGRVERRAISSMFLDFLEAEASK